MIGYKKSIQWVKVNQWVLYLGQWYVVESIEGDELFLLGDDGIQKTCQINQIDLVKND